MVTPRPTCEVYRIVATTIPQVPRRSRKVNRRRGTRRIWIRGSRLEQQGVRAVAKHRGMTNSELLRRFSLNDVMKQFHALNGG